ncbi:MAG: tetratricopeptide repeat protein [Candidatus Hydrogenedentes bacterium]|nr:tetratricopeptide repeat protein [Candidatus Hydrogenedentota bacterium]
MNSSEAEQKYKQSRDLYRQQLYAESLRLLDELDVIHPNNRNILFARAKCLEHLGRPSQAIEICDRLEILFGDARATALKRQLKEAIPSTPPEDAGRSPGGRWRLGLGVAAGIIALLAGVGTIATYIALSQKAPPPTRPSRLRVLSLHDNPIADRELVFVENMTSLQRLDLSNTGVSDDAVEHLFALSSLQELQLGGNSLSPDILGELRSALPNTAINGP